MSLSPGTHHTKVPRDRAGNAALRSEVLAACLTSPRSQEKVRRACAEDILFYANLFAYTYNPRRPAEKTVPFVTYPYQDAGLARMLYCVQTGRDLVIEKSRDMGASWMTCLLFQWMWLFKPECSFLMMSRNEELVDGGTDDRGNPVSLFWKLDFLNRHLPDWMLPKDISRKRNHLGNPATGSTINGEATTSQSTVGDRRTAIFLDEFSRVKESDAWNILAGTADVSDCRLFNFTPWGTRGPAFALAQRSDVEKLRMHWSEHPVKAAGLYRFDPSKGHVVRLDKGFPFPADYPFILDGRLRSPWYDEQCRRRSPREVAVMLDIDYQGSNYAFFDRQRVEELKAVYCRQPDWEGDIECDPDTGALVSLVRQEGGPLKLWVKPDLAGRMKPGRYVLGADISRGTGATNSCATVLDAATGERVGEYVTPFVEPGVFAARVVALCRAFPSAAGEPAKLAWEMQGPGEDFGKKVLRTGFRNVYYRRNELSVSKKENVDQPGWYPSPAARDRLLASYRAALQGARFVNRSREALDECLEIVVDDAGHAVHSNTNKKALSETKGPPDPSGAGVNHGDRVVADALAWMLAEPSQPRPGQDVPPEQGVVPGSRAWRNQLALKQLARSDRWGDG